MLRITSKTKLLAGAIGVGGVVAMGGLTMAVGGFQPPAAGAAVSARPALTGAGSTVTQAPVHALPKAPSTLETPAASPNNPPSAWQGGGWQGFEAWQGQGNGHGG